MREIDPFRLHVAAHELGHMITWEVLGLAVKEALVWGHGTEAEGRVRLNDQRLRNPAECRDYLFGLLAGREADIQWCRTTGRTFHPHTCSGDLKVFRAMRKHQWVSDIPDAEFRANARGLVLTHWRRITRLAPVLARRGSL